MVAELRLPDEHKRRRFHLREQEDAYILTMADTSMVFDGRDFVSYYKAKLRESEKIRSEILFLSSLVYKPIQSTKGKRQSSPPHETSNHVIDSSTNKYLQDKTISHHDRTKDPRVSEKPDGMTTSEECIPSSTTHTGNTSQRNLIRRKKSSPKHRCSDKNCNLKSALREPKYPRTKDLKCMLQLAQQESHNTRERKLVYFQDRVEVYCYKSE